MYIPGEGIKFDMNNPNLKHIYIYLYILRIYKNNTIHIYSCILCTYMFCGINLILIFIYVYI